jgi:hypothetical protein
VAEEGAEGSATAESLGGGVKESVAEVEEVAEGVISDTMLGAHFFAYLKNPSISERGRAGEDPILAQSTSSPYDWARAITPLYTTLHRGALQGEHRIFNSIKSLNEFLEIVAWHLPPFFRPEPDKYANKHVSS